MAKALEKVVDSLKGLADDTKLEIHSQAELTRCASRFRRREPILGGSRARAFPPAAEKRSLRLPASSPSGISVVALHARADASLARAHRVSTPRLTPSVHLSTQGVASAAQGRGHPPDCRRLKVVPPPRQIPPAHQSRASASFSPRDSTPPG